MKGLINLLKIIASFANIKEHIKRINYSQHS